MLSVLILTHNEEVDLPGCLKSVSWCDDVHVFDSFSDDKTIEIAIRSGAKVIQRKFDGYASQRNAALTTVNYKYPWVFFLDADERIPLALLNELEKRLKDIQDTISALRFRRRDYLNTVWLRHAQISPWYIRVFRPEKVHYHREINEVIEVDGDIIEIKEYFEHYPFSKGYRHWLNKHNRYSSMEAQRWIEEHKTNMKFSLKKAILSKDFTERRFHQKGLFYKMPGRPFIKWLYMMIGRKAFLDGKAGITYATLQAIYEYFIVLKTREIKKNLRDENQIKESY